MSTKPSKKICQGPELPGDWKIRLLERDLSKTVTAGVQDPCLIHGKAAVPISRIYRSYGSADSNMNANRTDNWPQRLHLGYPTACSAPRCRTLEALNCQLKAVRRRYTEQMCNCVAKDRELSHLKHQLGVLEKKCSVLERTKLALETRQSRHPKTLSERQQVDPENEEAEKSSLMSSEHELVIEEVTETSKNDEAGKRQINSKKDARNRKTTGSHKTVEIGHHHDISPKEKQDVRKLKDSKNNGDENRQDVSQKGKRESRRSESHKNVEVGHHEDVPQKGKRESRRSESRKSVEVGHHEDVPQKGKRESRRSETRRSVDVEHDQDVPPKDNQYSRTDSHKGVEVDLLQDISQKDRRGSRSETRKVIEDGNQKTEPEKNTGKRKPDTLVSKVAQRDKVQPVLKSESLDQDRRVIFRNSPAPAPQSPQNTPGFAQVMLWLMIFVIISFICINTSVDTIEKRLMTFAEMVASFYSIIEGLFRLLVQSLRLLMLSILDFDFLEQHRQIMSWSSNRLHFWPDCSLAYWPADWPGCEKKPEVTRIQAVPSGIFGILRFFLCHLPGICCCCQ